MIPASSPGLVAAWSLPVPLVFPRFGHVFRWICRIFMPLVFSRVCHVFRWICRSFTGFSSISSGFWVPRFPQKIANPFYSIVVLMPFMRFAKVLTGCLVTLGLCKGSMLLFWFPELQRKLLTHFLPLLSSFLSCALQKFWSRRGPCQCPWFFLDFVTFSVGFVGSSKAFPALT